MGASDDELTKSLTAEFPRAAIKKAAGALSTWTSAIVSHLEGRRPHLELPVDIQATAFQWQVWLALAAIPYG